MEKDTAVILNKTRTADRIETPETQEAQGRRATAAEMREHNVARELFFQVGKHVYLVMEWTNGRRSVPSKIF
jgi:hypothetical protein